MHLRKFIPKEEVLTLDIIRFPGKVVIVDDPEELEELLILLSKEAYLGFDTETKPSFKKGEYHNPAIIQISTQETAYLIRIQKTGFTNAFKLFFENKSVIKIGISIRDDLKDMRKVREFEPGGFIDLNNVAGRLGITQIGVKSLTGIFLKRRVSKGQQTSNWENEILTEKQQNYAATDAWICLEIYSWLLERGYV